MHVQHLIKGIFRISMLPIISGVLFLSTSQNLIYRSSFSSPFYFSIGCFIFVFTHDNIYAFKAWLSSVPISCFLLHLYLLCSLYSSISFPHAFLCLVSVCPTFGGSNPGLRAELIHSVNEDLSLICGCAYTIHPSAFASISVSYFWINKVFWFSHCRLSYK